MASEKFRSKLLGEINAMKSSEESINTFGRNILALLMKDYHLHWVDIKSLLGKLTKSLDVTTDESTIKEIVSREICNLFDSRPTAALITKKGEANIVLFIGITKGHPHQDPRGYGKTTAIVRYALQYRNNKSENDHVPYVVCADARRPNAFKKLKQLSGGRVNGYTPDKKEGPIGGLKKALKSFGNKDTTALVIMDVNARHLGEISQKMVSLNCDYSIIVVLDGTVESKEISNQIEICRNAKLLNGLAFIITKMDLHLGLGAIMTAAKGRYPIAMIGTGEGVDDYIYEPNVESFMSECLSFDQTQISSDAILQESAENSPSSSKEAGEELNWDSPKIGSTKPTAKEQILDTKDICIDTKEMNTNESDQEEETEPSKVEDGAKKSFFEAHIQYVIEGDSCRAKYLDDRDDKDFVTVKVFAERAMKEESKAVGVFAEKVCFICDFTNWVYDCDDEYRKIRKSGFYVFVEDLSKLVDGCMELLKPKFTIDFDDAMSIAAIDSTLFFTNVIFNYRASPPTIYSRDIQTLTPDQVVGADDFCTLPRMLGKKRWPRLASIPGSKKLLVFSSVFSAYPCGFPFPPHNYAHFEMFDVETNSWEKLPQFLVRKSSTSGSYLLHMCDAEEETIEIAIRPRDFREYDYKYKIYAYALSLTDEGRKAVFLVQLTCGGVTLALDLDLDLDSSASKSWRLYDGERDGVAHSWVYPQGGKRDAAFRDPKSLSVEDDRVKRVCYAATDMDGEKRVCVVRAGTGGRSKHGLVTLDVVNLMAEKDVLASYNFVMEKKFKYFIPMFAFLYHPKLN